MLSGFILFATKKSFARPEGLVRPRVAAVVEPANKTIAAPGAPVC